MKPSELSVADYHDEWRLSVMTDACDTIVLEAAGRDAARAILKRENAG